jgi:hypothetical protein
LENRVGCIGWAAGNDWVARFMGVEGWLIIEEGEGAVMFNGTGDVQVFCPCGVLGVSYT